MKFSIREVDRRPAEGLVACLIEADHPPIGARPHFNGIEPECKDLILVEISFQAQSKPGLTYFPNAWTKCLKAKSLGKRLGNCRETRSPCAKIYPSMLPEVRVLHLDKLV